jgi:hypothetical protein
VYTDIKAELGELDPANRGLSAYLPGKSEKVLREKLLKASKDELSPFDWFFSSSYTETLLSKGTSVTRS